MYQPWAQSDSRVRYALAKKAKAFKTAVAFNDTASGGHFRPVVFRVHGDGKLLWESRLVQNRHEPQEVELDVGAVDELDLELCTRGNGSGSPAVWVEPRLFTDAAAAANDPPSLPARTNVLLARGAVPRGRAVNVPLAGESHKAGKATATRLKLDAKDLPGCLCWSRDGKAFFYLDAASGRLGRVVLDGLTEDGRLEIGRKCTWLSVSSEGLVVTVSSLEEVWVVDLHRLAVKARLKAPGATRVVSSPALSLAFSGRRGESALGTPPRLDVFDLKSGERVEAPPPTGPPNTERPEFKAARVTEDGKYLFTQGGGRLHRFRIEGDKVTWEQTGPAIGQGAEHDLCLSPDGKYVCLPSGGGNGGFLLLNHPAIKPYCTYVYRVTELNGPAFVVEQGIYPTVVAFDPPARRIYANTDDNHLLLFGERGGKREALTFWHERGEGKQTLVHPEGQKLLLLGTSLSYVEVPSP
jgi:hypothetical protein